jgi:hypothetical protein
VQRWTRDGRMGLLMGVVIRKDYCLVVYIFNAKIQHCLPVHAN